MEIRWKLDGIEKTESNIRILLESKKRNWQTNIGT